jgi:hypothetical protein
MRAPHYGFFMILTVMGIFVNARAVLIYSLSCGHNTSLVYTVVVLFNKREYLMKNITLSADENLIEAARRRAVAEHSTLNEQFRLWLDEYVRRNQQADAAMATIKILQKHISTRGRKFTRDEMNER